MNTFDKKRLGLIGTGIMGFGMASNLLKAGYSLNVFSRTKAKAGRLIDRGAVWKNSVKTLAAESDVVITIVGLVEDVEAVYFGADGILENAAENTIVIDMTTSSPELAAKIYEAAEVNRLSALDAPVSGGEIGAQKGELSIMVGGDEDIFNACLPIFEAMGKNIVFQGGPGCGQNTKMCNQIAIAAGMVGVCEALAYAARSGLDPTTVLRSISNGAAGSWLLSNMGPAMIFGRFEPGFFVKHFIKDMKIALGSARAMGLDVPGLDMVLSMYEALAAKGCEDDGIQALFKWYQS